MKTQQIRLMVCLTYELDTTTDLSKNSLFRRVEDKVFGALELDRKDGVLNLKNLTDEVNCNDCAFLSVDTDMIDDTETRE